MGVRVCGAVTREVLQGAKHAAFFIAFHTGGYKLRRCFKIRTESAASNYVVVRIGVDVCNRGKVQVKAKLGNIRSNGFAHIFGFRRVSNGSHIAENCSSHSAVGSDTGNRAAFFIYSNK